MLVVSYVIRHFLATSLDNSKHLQIFNVDINVYLDIGFIAFCRKNLTIIPKSDIKQARKHENRELSMSNMHLKSIMFSWVAVLLLTIEKWSDPRAYPDPDRTSITINLAPVAMVGAIIAVGSQIIFRFSIYNQLTAILDGSMYQVSKKEIEAMKIANICGIILPILPLAYIKRGFNYNSDDDGNIAQSYLILTLLGLPWFISEIIFISLGIRCYYVKTKEIITDLRDIFTRVQQGNNGKRKIDNLSVGRMSQEVESMLLSKLVKSIILNFLFGILMMFEAFMFIYGNYHQFSMQEKYMIAMTTMFTAMVVLTILNSLSAVFNHQLYQKYCQKCHYCCVALLERCL